MLTASKRLIQGCATTGLISGMIVGVFATRADAAYYERVTATACQVTDPDQEHQYPVWYVGGGYLANESSTTNTTFVCQIPDKTDLKQQLISKIEIDVYDGNNDSGKKIAVRACAFNAADTTSGSCDSWAYSDNNGTNDNFTGWATLELSDEGGNDKLDSLGTSGETAYLRGSIPPVDGTVRSKLTGLYFEDD